LPQPQTRSGSPVFLIAAKTGLQYHCLNSFRQSMVSAIARFIPNSKKLLAVLCIMLAAEMFFYTQVHKRHEALVKEKDRLIQETNELMKHHKKPAGCKDVQT
jgi:hypothetical protein